VFILPSLGAAEVTSLLAERRGGRHRQLRKEGTDEAPDKLVEASQAFSRSLEKTRAEARLKATPEGSGAERGASQSKPKLLERSGQP